MDYDAYNSFNGINFGLMEGSKGLLIVKSGANGKIYGEDNKYLILAERIKSKYGFSVIVSDNPLKVNESNNMLYTMALAKQYKDSKSIEDTYYFGNSRGAMCAALYAYQYEWVSRWVAVNMPITVNWHRTRAGLERLSDEQQITFVFGQHDPSRPYSDLVSIIGKKNIKKIIIPDADHKFSKSRDEFIRLPETLLFEDSAG